MSFVDREEFIELLEKLRSEEEADVLAAAKEITRVMDEGAVSWEDLLRKSDDPDDPDDLYDDDGYSEDSDYDEDEDGDGYDDAASDTGEAVTLIEHILSTYELSQSTEDDLRDYLDDIENEEFSEADNRYLQALHSRLKKQQPGKGA